MTTVGLSWISSRENYLIGPPTNMTSSLSFCIESDSNDSHTWFVESSDELSYRATLFAQD